jgi:ribosomal protein L37AE/L43A
MLGRYGSDALNLALILTALVLSVAARFIPVPLVGYLPYLPLFYALFRLFSRNIPRRRAENDRFLRATSGVRRRFGRTRAAVRDRKFYRYFSCPACKKTLRVPRGKGKLAITCPKCGERFYRDSGRP